MEKVSQRHRSVETDEEHLPRAQDNLHGFVEIRKRSRLKCFLDELDVTLDQLVKYVLVVLQLGEGLFHSVSGAQFAAHLLLNLSPELRETFVAQDFGVAHHCRLTDTYGSRSAE